MTAAPPGDTAVRFGICTAALTLTLLYAVVRYHAFGSVPWKDLPVFTVNKAVSWSAVLLLLIGQIRRRRGLHAAPLFGQALALTGLHLVLSLSILTAAWFPAFFADGRFTLSAGISMLAGAIAATLAVGPRRSLRVQIVAPLLVAAHVGLIGYVNWFKPSGWPGGLVPISLLITAAALLLVAFRSRPS